MPVKHNAVEDNLSENEVILILNNPQVRNEYSVYLNKEIGEVEHYRKFCNLLRGSNELDKFLIYINNYGGFVNTGIDIINAMRAAQGKICVVVTGPLYSMAPLIALSAPKLVIESNTFFMFHDYSGGTSGKGSEQIASITHEKPFFDEMFTNITKNFLTNAEIKSVINGKDLYLKRNDIMKRLKKMKKLIS